MSVALIFITHLTIAQNQIITVDTTITSDCEFYPFSSVSTIQGLGFSGSVTLNSDSSLVRLIYIDGDNNEWLLMESYPMITNDFNINYSDYSDETRYFDNNPTGSILVEIIDASINIDALICSTVPVLNAGSLREQAKYNNDLAKVNAINRYNLSHNLRWTAGYNDIVGKWYVAKMQMLGNKYNTLVFEYYHSGIFETVFTQVQPIQTNMVPYFDWRSRHDSNIEGTPYYDGNVEYATGWLSPTKAQGSCGACWAFSTTAVVEAVSNLYYNISNLNPDLAEQELISCLYDDNCQDGGYPTSALQYITDNGIDNEDCFPYDPLNADNIDCDDPSHCQIPDYHTTIENYDNVNDNDIDNILLKLITKGPLQVTHYFPGQGTHGMSLIGYSYIDQNSEILWLVENSWGTTWGDHGVGWIKRRYQDLNPKSVISPVTITNSNPNDSPVRQWSDKDGDGIYWWGIGVKPAECPGNAYNEDCNDDDPALGGYDANYNCICLMPYRFDPLVIDDNTMWGGDDKLIDCDIEIESGATLTIHNTVKLTDNARIIVKKGAKLIVDGGTITNLCTKRWKGIEVWGTSNLPQDQQGAQGIVELKNGATIENAITAVETIKRSNPNYFAQTYYREYSGGIVTIDNATIKNCETGIRFWPYPYGSNYEYATLQQQENISTIKNTHFLVDEEFLTFPSTTLFNSMIYLDGINGISLESNLLENNQQALYEMGKRGYGIYANNSNFHLSKGVNNSSIKNFNYGVYSISSGELNGFTSIHETVFDQNKTGVYISYPDNMASPVDILFNEFYTAYGNAVDRSSGLYLDNTYSFIVEENAFTGDRKISPIGIASNSSTYTYGIVVNNCGEATNRLYNNEINGFDFGIQAQDYNRSRDGLTGLKIKCNDYTVCNYDTRVLGHTPILSEYGIAENQGSSENNTTSPAGNTFYYFDTPSYNDIFNNTNNITYWYHAITNGTSVIPESYSDDLVFPNANQADPQSYIKEQSCPSHYVVGGYKSTEDNKLEFIAYSLKADSIRAELNLLVDDGNTEALNDDVQSSWPDETMELRQQLLNASPYLSDTVMISAVVKEDVLPNAILTEILSSNPQSSKSNKVMESVDQRDTLLSQAQYDLVMQGRLSAGAKEKLESRLSDALSRRESAMKKLIMEWHDDTLENATDSIIDLLQDEENINAKYTLVELFINKKDTLGAINEYNSINSDFSLNTDEYENWLKYGDWMAYKKDKISMGESTSEPDSSQLSFLYELYNNSQNQLKTAIRNLLKYADTLTYNEPYLSIDTTLKYDKVRFRPTGNNKGQNNLLTYPNPVRDYVIIDFSDMNIESNKLITAVFYSIDGKMIFRTKVNTYTGFKVIDTRGWTPGTYSFMLSDNGKLLGSGKLIKTY